MDRGPENGSRDNINLEGASYVDIEGFEITSAWRAGIRAVECQHAITRCAWRHGSETSDCCLLRSLRDVCVMIVRCRQ